MIAFCSGSLSIIFCQRGIKTQHESFNGTNKKHDCFGWEKETHDEKFCDFNI